MPKIIQPKYFPRLLLWDLQKLISRPEIFAIRGPRQSGKTTLLKMLKDWLVKEKKVSADNIVFITFEDREILEQFSEDPQSYVRSFIGEKSQEKFYFFIDEFHYLKNGGQILKLLYDVFDNIKFVVTGSSSLELIGKTAKFLVGRIFFFNLWQMTFEEYIGVKSQQLSNVYRQKAELLRRFLLNNKNFPSPKKDIFSNDFEKYFEEYAVWGGYPAVVSTKDRETKRTILKNIYDVYISKDIIELLKITDYSAFKNLVVLLSAQIGNLVNYNSLARDAQSYFKEIKQYLSVLEETYVTTLVKPFFKSRTSEIKKNPMVYFFDVGLRNYAIDNFNKLSLRADLGRLVENVAFSQLRFKQEDNYSVKYWRTLGKAEVDFLLEKRSGELIPLEVKYSALRVPNISRGFRSFLDQYQPKRALILTRGFWAEKKIGTTIIKFAPVWYL